MNAITELTFERQLSTQDIRRLTTIQFHRVQAMIEDSIPAVWDMLLKHEDTQLNVNGTVSYLIELPRLDVAAVAKKILLRTFNNNYLTDTEKFEALTEDPPQQYVMEAYLRFAKFREEEVKEQQRYLDYLAQRKVKFEKQLERKKKIEVAAEKDQMEREQLNRRENRKKLSEENKVRLQWEFDARREQLKRDIEETRRTLSSVDPNKATRIVEELKQETEQKALAEREMLLTTVRRVAREMKEIYQSVRSLYVGERLVDADGCVYLQGLDARRVTLRIADRLTKATTAGKLDVLEIETASLAFDAIESLMADMPVEA